MIFAFREEESAAVAFMWKSVHGNENLLNREAPLSAFDERVDSNILKKVEKFLNPLCSTVSDTSMQGDESFCFHIESPLLI